MRHFGSTMPFYALSVSSRSSIRCPITRSRFAGSQDRDPGWSSLSGQPSLLVSSFYNIACHMSMHCRLSIPTPACPLTLHREIHNLDGQTTWSTLVQNTGHLHHGRLFWNHVGDLHRQAIPGMTPPSSPRPRSVRNYRATLWTTWRTRTAHCASGNIYRRYLHRHAHWLQAIQSLPHQLQYNTLQQTTVMILILLPSYHLLASRL